MLNHDFKLLPSKFYLFLLASVYFMSIGAVLFLPVFWAYKIPLILAASFYAKGILYRYGLLQHPCSVHAILQNDEGKWLIKTNNGEREAQLSPDSVVTHWVCVLTFSSADEGLPFNCVIFPDALLKDEFRKLLVLLRMF